MDIEDDKKMIIDNPINLEEAANTLIQIGLQELQQPQDPQPNPQPNQKRGPGKQQLPSQKKKRNKSPFAGLQKKLNETLKELATRIDQVNELQAKIKSMDHNMTINIDKPKFESSLYTHPLNFIENLKTYLDNNLLVKNPVETAFDCLYGDAKSWASILKPRWGSFEDFKKDFLDHFWGPAEQSTLRSEIINGYWDRNTETMCRHFLCLVAQAKWLPHQIPDEQLVYEIMTHYPKYVQIAWCTSKDSTVLEAIQFLRKFDNLEDQMEKKNKLNPNPATQQFQKGKKRTPQLTQQPCRYTMEKQSTPASVRHVASNNIVLLN